jgi:hypothetical protein
MLCMYFIFTYMLYLALLSLSLFFFSCDFELLSGVISSHPGELPLILLIRHVFLLLWECPYLPSFLKGGLVGYRILG